LEDRVKYWIELSDYDLETAKAMLVSGRLLYVGYMCHQTIEKILKAYISNSSAVPPPHSHNLTLLAEKCSFFNDLAEDHLDLINILEPLNIEARYPTQKEILLKSLTKVKCNEIIKRSLNFQKWVKERL